MILRSRLMLALLLWLAALSIAAAVAAGLTQAFDATLLPALAVPARAAGWPVAILLVATAIGSAAVRLPIAAAVAICLAIRRDRRGAITVAAVAIGMLAGNAWLKTLIGRARPELLPHLAVETSLSFPSGHAANAAAVFPVLAWAAARHGVRPAVAGPIAILLVLAIGLSRVVLGVHWPTDVLAGWCVGAGWMLLCVGVADRSGRTRVPPALKERDDDRRHE